MNLDGYAGRTTPNHCPRVWVANLENSPRLCLHVAKTAGERTPHQWDGWEAVALEPTLLHIRPGNLKNHASIPKELSVTNLSACRTGGICSTRIRMMNPYCAIWA